MKTLTLIRHAKSSWDDPSLRDFDRPLNKRGHRNAPFMGQILNARGTNFDRVYASPARRAIDTAQYICGELECGADAIEVVPDLYDAGAQELLGLIRGADDAFSSIAVVAHNPGLTHLTNLLADAPIVNVPTTGVVSFELDIESWAVVGATAPVACDFDYPKKPR